MTARLQRAACFVSLVSVPGLTERRKAEPAAGTWSATSTQRRSSCERSPRMDAMIEVASANAASNATEAPARTLSTATSRIAVSVGGHGAGTIEVIRCRVGNACELLQVGSAACFGRGNAPHRLHAL